jgi:ABC-type antimicrobial peptide transport system permease subunit
MLPMVIKNLFRRKGRTLLTVVGISVGVAAIVALGALAEGFEASYNSMLFGSKADLVISQPDSFDISMSSVDESVGEAVSTMPEVDAVTGMIEGFVQTEGLPLFFVFGYPEDSYALDRFQIVDGDGLGSTSGSHQGKPLLLGSAAADSLNKIAGDTLRIGESSYRIIGIYETGDSFEDSGAVLPLRQAQEMLGKTRQVSILYVQLKDPQFEERFRTRMERLYTNLSVSTTSEYADKQIMGDALKGYSWAIAGLAILIGGVGMMNAQLMSVVERTREIGVLKAVGWSSRRVMGMILSEAFLVCLAGGVLGIVLAWLVLTIFSDVVKFFGTSAHDISGGLILQAFIVVIVMGLIAGMYPAWRASKLDPIEAIRYEGGTSGESLRRFPVGGMAVQSVWQRSTRSLLTLVAIGITVGGIMALEGIVNGTAELIGDIAFSSDVEILIRQADIADTSMSAIDERIGDRIAALSDVENVSGMTLTAVMLTNPTSFFILEGFEPGSYAIRRFNIVEGERISGNHQIMLGRIMSTMLSKNVGETVDLSGTRFRIVGIYETGESYEEMGGVITLRDLQSFTGRPRKVMMYLVKVVDPERVKDVAAEINAEFPEVHAALAGEFAEQMPDFENMNAMLAGISFLAIAVGGVTVMNTMLMAVLERTREIGVLRALGWRSRKVLQMILRESFLIGILGGIAGIIIALGLGGLLSAVPLFGESIAPVWTVEAFLRALIVALLLGLAGGLYPAIRATRLEPIEALRYE